MSVRNTADHEPGPSGASPVPYRSADLAYRRAWWSLALYPLTLLAAFIIGEGLLSLVAPDPAAPVLWEVIVAATPALLIFVIPGVLAVTQGLQAVRGGRPAGAVPAVIGAAIGAGFVALNVASYLAGLLSARS